jgi:predicted HNH restriction endonuclease
MISIGDAGLRCPVGWRTVTFRSRSSSEHTAGHERDPKLRRNKIADAKRLGLPIACEVCSLDFGQVYGPHGLDYIECHHRVPLHVTGQTQTRLADLILLCSNCHRMIHRTRQWLTVEELRNLLATQRIVRPTGSLWSH